MGARVYAAAEYIDERTLTCRPWWSGAHLSVSVGGVVGGEVGRLRVLGGCFFFRIFLTGLCGERFGEEMDGGDRGQRVGIGG